MIDASAAARLFLPHDTTAVAERVFQHFTLIAPGLIVAELTNVYWKYVAFDRMPEDAAHLALTATMNRLDLRDDAGLAEEALRLAAALNHAAYDCFYIALADREKCPLITADKKLVKKLEDVEAVAAFNLHDPQYSDW